MAVRGGPFCQLSDRLKILNCSFSHRHCAGSVIGWDYQTNRQTTCRSFTGFQRKGRSPMLLRDHPLMQYHGLCSWPPVWTSIDGPENKHPRGEIGILRQVVPSKISPAKRCYLYIEYERSEYIGCLLFDDSRFCKSTNQAVAELL